MGKNEKVTISQATGLTPTQEQAAALLASGVSVTEVAERLELSRSVIYLWQKQTTFKVYFNRRCSDARNTLLSGLYGLAAEAMAAIRDSLQSNNEQVRLKAATWLADKLESVEIGQTDVIAAIKGECTHADEGANFWQAEPYFHKDEYSARLRELGLKEQDYKSTLK